MSYNSVLNLKALVGGFYQEKDLVGAFSVITNLRMELFEALLGTSGSRGSGGAASPRSLIVAMPPD